VWKKRNECMWTERGREREREREREKIVK
jgi:hypothetical protein